MNSPTSSVCVIQCLNGIVIIHVLLQKEQGTNRVLADCSKDLSCSYFTYVCVGCERCPVLVCVSPID